MLQTHFQTELPEAGLDEAGRGCFAGPVFAAAVVLPAGFEHPLLNDSKQVKEKDRYLLRAYIMEHALDYAVAEVSSEEIDRINILQASFKAMHLALDQLKRCRPGLLLVDGNRFLPYGKVPHHCFVEGDGRFASIAAASILAKTFRDDHMKQLHHSFPQYHWDQNKGYGTARHRQALEQFGPCPQHRKSFQLMGSSKKNPDALL